MLRPASLFVAGFIGAPPINLFEGSAGNGRLEIDEVTLGLEGRATGAVTLGIRPEHFRFAAEGLPGRIDQIEPMGREILYVIDTPLGPVRILDAATTARYAIGAEVGIAFEAENTHLFDSGTGAALGDVRVSLTEGA